MFSIMIVQIVAHFSQISNGRLEDGGRVAGEQIEARVKDAQEGVKNSIIESITSKVFPAITESPVLAPIFKTTKEVEGTINSIKNLPEEQKNAVCRQICGN